MKKRDSWKTNWVVGLLVFVFIGVIALWLAINNDMVMMGPDEEGNSVRGECGMILEGSELVMDDRTVGGGRIERDIPGNKFSLDKIKKRNLEMAEVISKPKVEIKSRGEKAKHNLDEKSVVMADDVTVSYDLAEKYVRDILFEKGLERKSDKNDLKEQAFEIIEETKSATGIEKENLVEKKAIKVKSLELISFSQNYKGVPVYLGDVKALKSGDKWVKINSNYYNEIDLDVNPLLSREQAIEKARQQLCIIGEPLDEPSLVVYPFISKQGKKYYLTYKVELPLHEYSNGQLLRPSVFVDAKTGGIIDVIDNIREETASGRITGDIIPDYYGQARETRNFSNEYLISGDYESTSDNLGGYNFDIGSNSQLQTKLEGSWVRLVNDIQEESQANLNLPPYQNDIDWVQYDNSYQKEESNVYYHVNRIHDFFVRGEEPFNMLGLNYQMIANVELDGDCNAYATGDSINFFRPGQCEPLSLYSDVIYHEYTHNMVARVAPQLSSVYWGETGNMNEGYADYYSCSLNNNSCLTEGFLGMSCMRNCENTKRYPEDYGDEPHYAAEVVSGALWDIRQAVGQEKGDELALLALSMDPQTFSELATNYLIVDDAVYGNGDLSDGTPDIEAICDSFYMNHGVYSIYCFNDLPLVARMINLPSYTSMDSYIDLEGVAGGTNFDHYNLSFRKEGSSSENEIISSLLRTSAEGDVLYIGFNASLLENGKNHIILRVWDSFGNSIEEVNVIFMDRFLKKGWPVVFNGLGGSYGPSLLADLNGDGMKEIVLAGTMNPRVHLFHPNGSEVSGWPISQSDPFGSSGGASLSDLDNDGSYEIIFTSSETGFLSNVHEGKDVYALKYDNSSLAGWPVDLPSNYSIYSPPVVYHSGNKHNVLILGGMPFPLPQAHPRIFVINTTGTVLKELVFNDAYNDGLSSSRDDFAFVTVAIGDINSDEIDEIVLASSNKLYAWDSDYGPLAGFPKTFTNGEYGVYVRSHTVLADIESDGQREIIFSVYNESSRNNTLFVLDAMGNLKSGWPKNCGRHFMKDIAVANFDYNSQLEIITSNCFDIFVFDTTGGLLGKRVMEQPIFADDCPYLFVGDINGDNAGEIVTSSAKSRLVYVLNSSLDVLLTTYIPSFSLIYSPSFADLEDDNLIDMVTSSYGGLFGTVAAVYAHNYDFAEGDFDWPMYQHDAQHTGCYDCDNSVTPSIVCNPLQLIGDANGDGIVNNIDYDLVAMTVSGEIAVPSNICCVDMDFDWNLTSKDQAMIQEIYLGNRLVPGRCGGCVRCPDLNRDRVVNTTDGNSLYTFFGTDNYREDYDLNNDSGLTIAGNPIGDLGCLGNNLGNATSVIPECQLTCKDYDANGDNVVNPSDYTYIRGKMGCDFNNGTACRRADVNRDGVVNPSDYTKVRGKIGSICEICNDGIDNNGNGMIDCMDNECLVECVRY